MGGDTDLQDEAEGPPRSVTPGWVVVVHGESRGVATEVPTSGLSIGREEGEPGVKRLCLFDALVSRHHVRIFYSEVGWRLTDVGSRNRGTVDGVAFDRGSTVTVRDGAVVRLGNTLLVFRTQPPPLERVPRATPWPDGPGAPGAAPGVEPGPRQLADAFPGSSRQAIKVRQQLALLTSGSGPVLIVGETGTGKEHVARALHKPDAPYLPVNCAQLGKELAASELFGHVRNAFTGATGSRAGLVEKAHGGVLFLDEIGELEYEVQAMLLRFLEDGYYRPVGSTELRKSTARVVAATNVDLEVACARGTFRADLLARLSTAASAIELPPLRERREDLVTWGERFWREHEPHSGAEQWTANAAESLLLYGWPRNLRELRGVMNEVTMRRCARALDGEPLHKLERDDLPDVVVGRRATTVPPAPSPNVQAAQPVAYLDRREVTPSRARSPTRDEVMLALHECGGNVRQAAKRLGIERRKIYRLFEKYGINPRAGSRGDDDDDDDDGGNDPE